MSRERRNVNELSGADVDLLEKAFLGIMARDETEDLSLPIDEAHPERISYFRLAAFHGYITYHCYHGKVSFFHWHRKYVYLFEEALRSVPGCGDVTLPYLDTTAKAVDFPDWIWTRPAFASYKIPSKYQSVDPTFDAGEHFLDYDILCSEEGVLSQGLTTRDSKADVVGSIKSNPDRFYKKVNYDLENFQSFWAVFESIHNAGHNSLGGNLGNNQSGNMSSVPVAAFDPVFWFHHSNVERWLWIWENKHNLNSSAGYENPNVFPAGNARDEFFNSRFEDYFEVGNGLTRVLKEHRLDFQGFKGSVKEVLDNPQIYKVPYVTHENVTPTGALRAFSLGAVEHGPITVAPQFSILVKNIDRSKIIGSFFVILTVNGVEHENYIFQIGPTCVNCEKNPFISSLFIVNETPATVSLRAVDRKGNELNIGTPKLNIRLPLHAGGHGNIINA